MNALYVNFIAEKLGVKPWRVENCIQLLEEGATVPFISRYRKEATGTMTDVEVAETNFHYQRFLELDKRKEAVIKSIDEQQKLTPELQKMIEDCVESQRLEDIYLPFRPKRRTRASVAKEKGLEPLAEKMLSLNVENILKEAEKFVKEGVPTAEDALSGARDIIAEQISENIEIREELRSYYGRSGFLKTKVAKGKEEEGEKYADYFSYSAPLSKMPSHRVLAILRAVNEKILSVKVETDFQVSLKIMNRIFYRGKKYPVQSLFDQLKLSQEDALTRLLDPSIENETLKAAKERADLEAVKVFGENLKQLLLAAPVGQKKTMAIDPGFRTGCKVVCLD
ncbi:MAG: RNA-binding transcriptional accessory protein, partial [Bacteroidales bacterium]|nr:RNA-binding transcriptional accessory protein [Bacteroidales bacterium]